MLPLRLLGQHELAAHVKHEDFALHAFNRWSNGDDRVGGIGRHGKGLPRVLSDATDFVANAHTKAVVRVIDGQIIPIVAGLKWIFAHAIVGPI